MKQLFLLVTLFYYLQSYSQVSIVADINPGAAHGYITPVSFAFGGNLYFAANDGVTGSELWKVDGTTYVASLLQDINPGAGAGAPNNFTILGTDLYFTATNGTSGTELFKLDGGTGVVTLVKDIRPGSSSSPSNLTVFAGELYFSANDGVIGAELWKSDGTTAGTVMVQDIRAGSSSSAPIHLTVLGADLYFSANNGTNGYELRKVNSAGTVSLVKDVKSGFSSSSPANFTLLGTDLYFTADGHNGTTDFGIELWKSDGTTAGTVMVKNINPGLANASPSLLTVFGTDLYFRANDGANGIELWKSDGTIAGTVMVKDINGTSASSNPFNFTVFAGELYFTGNDGSSGYELWKSDGTTTGTVMVEDINPGATGSVPGSLTVFNDSLYFSANDGVNGGELWRITSTSAANLVQDIEPGAGSSTPALFTIFGDDLYFRALQLSSTYFELWRLHSVILPIELTFFDAKLNSAGEVDLEWQTATEINNDYFTIERSRNALDWDKINIITGAGNSNQVLTYSAIDNSLNKGVYYYRLKQTDFDGKYSYSEIRSVNIRSLESLEIAIFPNPSQSKITIEGNQTELKEILIYNVFGQDLTSFTKRRDVNETTVIIDLSHLNSGLYFIKTKTTNNKLYKE